MEWYFDADDWGFGVRLEIQLYAFVLSVQFLNLVGVWIIARPIKDV